MAIFDDDTLASLALGLLGPLGDVIESPSAGDPEADRRATEEVITLGAMAGGAKPLASAMERIVQAVREGRFDNKFAKQIAKNFGIEEAAGDLQKFGNSVKSSMLPDGTLDMNKLQRSNSAVRKRLLEFGSQLDEVIPEVIDPPIVGQNFQLGNEGVGVDVGDEAKGRFRQGQGMKKPVPSSGSAAEGVAEEAAEAADDFIDADFRRFDDNDIFRRGRESFRTGFSEMDDPDVVADAFNERASKLQSEADLNKVKGLFARVGDLDFTKLAKRLGIGGVLGALGYGGYKLATNKGVDSGSTQPEPEPTPIGPSPEELAIERIMRSRSKRPSREGTRSDAMKRLDEIQRELRERRSR